MNNDMENTPLWLDLRKEYIDDNFAKLQEYLKGCAVKQTNDSFYSITIDLMRQRVDDLLSTLHAPTLPRRDGQKDAGISCQSDCHIPFSGR